MDAKCVVKSSPELLFSLLQAVGSRKVLFENVFNTCKEKYNGYFQIIVSNPKKPRSLNQNAKYWGMCNEFGIAMGGMTKEEVHEGVKDRAVAERGYPVEENRISHRIKPMSSAKASTVEFNILIETLYQIAAESGYIFKSDNGT